MPLTLINWSFKRIPRERQEIVGYIVLPQPPMSLTINVIFIVLKRGNLVAQMLGKDKKHFLGQSGTVVSWTTYSGLVVLLVEVVG